MFQTEVQGETTGFRTTEEAMVPGCFEINGYSNHYVVVVELEFIDAFKILSLASRLVMQFMAGGNTQHT